MFYHGLIHIKVQKPEPSFRKKKYFPPSRDMLIFIRHAPFSPLFDLFNLNFPFISLLFLSFNFTFYAFSSSSFQYLMTCLHLTPFSISPFLTFSWNDIPGYPPLGKGVFEQINTLAYCLPTSKMRAKMRVSSKVISGDSVFPASKHSLKRGETR